MRVAAIIRIAMGLGLAVGIAGCSASPSLIVSDDAALCAYAAEAGSAESIAACRGRLAGQQKTRVASNASRIEGFALLNTPAPATDVADRCKQADPPAECGDVTGSIKRGPAQ